MSLQTWHAAAALTAVVAALVAAELGRRATARAVLKCLASLIFVTAGALLLPMASIPGRLLFAGLVLSAVGDVALLPRGKSALFLVGLGAFLLAHLCFAASFASRGLALPWVLGASALLVLGGAPLARWLARIVSAGMRVPVAAYVLTIAVMVALAAGATGAGARPTLLVGAVLFFLSDLCVARERFAGSSPWNGAVGLPLYYAAQLCLIDGLGPS